MTHHTFKERGQALEDLFFSKQDEQLIQQYRAKQEALAEKEALKAASGIHDDAVLDALIAISVTAESLAAVSLFPLIAVAWADRKMADEEIRAILKAADEAGIAVDSESHRMIEAWLIEPPSDQVANAWKSFVGELSANLDAESKAALKAEVLGRARRVAQAADGFLGLFAVSAAEEAKLAELELAFG